MSPQRVCLRITGAGGGGEGGFCGEELVKAQILGSGPDLPVPNLEGGGCHSEVTLLVSFPSDCHTETRNPVCSVTQGWDLISLLMNPSSLGSCPEMWCQKWCHRSYAQKSRNDHSGPVSTGRILLLNGIVHILVLKFLEIKAGFLGETSPKG